MSSSRRQYPFHLIEPKWQSAWEQQQTFRAFNPGDAVPAEHPFGARHGLSGQIARAEALPHKFYILDMFPYPSGAGLHVGHPEGYTATDILSRYRRACGYNVLHPMGWDSFGLPAEQYAVKTGQHPRKTTEQNIANFTRQIKSLGFSYDWSREIATTDVEYFKWTQWIFLKLYNSWFNRETNKAEPIETLKYPKWCVNEMLKNDFRDTQRLAYVDNAPVWWCEQLGTVLANEEVVDGKSEVGGFPAVRMYMRQWMLRITKYAERLINDLETIDWSDSLKQMQRNWIGKSQGAYVAFTIEGNPEAKPWKAGDNEFNSDLTEFSIEDDWPQSKSQSKSGPEPIIVFTTRPDTLFGATYMVLSPEHELVLQITTPEQRKAIEDYKTSIASKSERERTESKEKTGVFTGAYAINPVNGEKIPIWIADYVLASYGTGAIMAVPSGDERDFEFAKKFNLPIKQIVGLTMPLAFDAGKDKGFSSHGLEMQTLMVVGQEQTVWIYNDYCISEDGIAVNSANADISLNGLPTSEAKKKISAWLEEKGFGKKTINYKLRDWLFSRQRYWGEPFPIIWKNGHHEALPESALPVLPPTLEDYKPTATGEPPLARAKDWVNLPDGSTRETNTMPQWAGSCWYYLRYLDAKNSTAFVGKEADNYWMASNGKAAGVDLYVGGTEHAVLHLLYARFWHKVLFDLGLVSTPEPFYKLVNQGLILGEPENYAFRDEKLVPEGEYFAFRPNDSWSIGPWISADDVTDIQEIGQILKGKQKSTGCVVIGLKAAVPDEQIEKMGGAFVLKGQPDIKVEVRLSKMSKSRGNVVNPDDVLKEYGADAFRLYEMFMGPLQDTKPWNTKGVEGVYRFLGRAWRLFVDEKSEIAFEQAETTSAGTDQHAAALDVILLDSGITDADPTPAQLKALHQCIKKVTEDLDGMRFNTAISAMMVFVNEAMTWQAKPLSVMKPFIQLLAPFAPHLAEELWARLHSTFGLKPGSLTYAPWPKYDPALLVETEIELPVSVNGKVRDVIKVPVDSDNATLEAAAKAAEKVQSFLAGKTIKKVIIVPKRMVNLIVG